MPFLKFLDSNSSDCIVWFKPISVSLVTFLGSNLVNDSLTCKSSLVLNWSLPKDSYSKRLLVSFFSFWFELMFDLNDIWWSIVSFVFSLSLLTTLLFWSKSFSWSSTLLIDSNRIFVKFKIFFKKKIIIYFNLVT